jgi:hypothetical protein
MLYKKIFTSLSREKDKKREFFLLFLGVECNPVNNKRIIQKGCRLSI